MNNERIEILIPYYYNPDTRSLYNSKKGGNSVRTQFFSEEQTIALHIKEKEIERLLKNKDNTEENKK